MKFFLKIFLFSFAAFAKQTEKPLIIGTTSGYAPYVSLNDKGEYEGFDIDLSQELAKKLGRSLEIKDFGSMPGLMIALKQGKADALIWAISITKERSNAMEMIHYQGEEETEIPILFWKEVPDGIQSFDDLANKEVSVESGSFQEAVLKKYPSIRLKNLGSVNDAIMDLKYKKSIATSIDPSLISRFLAQYPELKIVPFPLPAEVRSSGNGICIRKSSPELASQVRKAIDELKSEGKIAELEKKWGLLK